MSELFKLKNGTVLVSTEAPGGIYNSAQLKKIADLCSKELAIVKATEDQRLALFVKEDELERVISELKTTGLGFRNYQQGLHQPVSCLGELCESHEQPALTTAMDLTRLIAEMNLSSPLKIGINGCARCCTPCHTLDISVIGEASGYRVSLGGKTSQFPELASFFAEAVPAKDLPRLLATVVELFKAKAEPGETFNEVLDRAGSEDFVSVLAPYSQDAAHRDDPFAVADAGEGDDAPNGSDEIDSEAALDDSELIAEESTSDDSNDELSELEDIRSTEVPEEELLPEESPEIEAEEHEAEFNFAEDGEALDEMAEVLIDDSEEIALPSDILVYGGEEPSIEDDAEFVFDDEALLNSEIAASEPELIEDESVELETDLPEPAEETDEAPELNEEQLDSAAESTAPVPELSILDEGDEGETMDTEAERLFEEKLQVSIDEDKTMRESIEVDENLDARADALRMLEDGGDHESAEDSLELADAHEPLVIVDEERDEGELDDVPTLELGDSQAISELASPPALLKKIKSTQDDDFDGFDLIDQTLRVSFSSGAYLDLQLDVLGRSTTRVFRADGLTIRVSHEDAGFVVEAGGMKMFYPHAALKMVS